MQTIGGNGVGRVYIRFNVANNDDLTLVEHGKLAPQKVRRITLDGVADPGATRLVLPQSVVKQLGLPSKGTIQVGYADGRVAQRPQARNVHLEILGRDGVFTAIVEPKRKTALVGAIVLEELDLLVDCPRERLIPRDPRGLIAEVE